MHFVVRDAESDDTPFIIEMAREASTIEDRPLPTADSAVVRAALPRCARAAVIGESPDRARLGAAWWHWHDPPLACDFEGRPLPEMVIAVRAEQRGHGVGTALIEALAVRVGGQFPSIVVNVHIRNPAACLYSRMGFTVMGKGRGPLGVAMKRDLPTPPPPG
jgi:GNAT superfamily N-acetyltransferase